MAGLMTALDNFGRTTGDYWSKDNAQFESTNPALLDRFGRAINPMTGFGSAIGAMADAAGKGFPVVDTGAALLQSLPAFGAVKAVSTPATGALKAGMFTANDWAKFLTQLGVGASASVGVDEAQAASNKRKEISQ